MGWFSSASNNVKYYARRTIEISNLKTEESLKNPSSLSNEILIAKNSSTRRAVASTVLGTMTNIAIAVVFPPYAAAAAVNVWQLSVSGVNRHRVRREVKRRKHDDKNFKAMYKECNKPVRDIVIGCSVKAALTTISMGVVGIDHVADGFQHLAQHAATGTHFIAGNAADGVAYTSTMSGKSHIPNIADTHDGSHHTQDSNAGLGREGQLKEHHPGIWEADEITNKSFSFASSEFAKTYGGTAAGNIEPDTSWDKIGEFLEKGVSKAELTIKVVSTGAFAELVQPATLFSEKCVDKLIDLRNYMMVRGFLNKSKLDVAAQMSGKELDDQVKREIAVQAEMKQTLKNRGVVN